MAPLEVQRRVRELVTAEYGGEVGSSPEWLNRPGKSECGRRRAAVNRIYTALTMSELPDAMPARERQSVDLVLIGQQMPPRIIEVDEIQHFNAPGDDNQALPRSATIAFDRSAWIAASLAKNRLEGGGFGRPCPPVFPGEGGRHKQRAFRDALADLLPAVRGWMPTLRIAHFEVPWALGAGCSAAYGQAARGCQVAAAIRPTEHSAPGPAGPSRGHSRRTGPSRGSTIR